MLLYSAFRKSQDVEKHFFQKKFPVRNFFFFEFKRRVPLISEMPEDIVKRGILKAEIKEKMNETRGNLSF